MVASDFKKRKSMHESSLLYPKHLGGNNEAVIGNMTFLFCSQIRPYLLRFINTAMWHLDGSEPETNLSFQYQIRAILICSAAIHYLGGASNTCVTWTRD